MRCILTRFYFNGWLLACLFVKREEENNRAHAPGFEFVVGTALSSTDCESSPLLSRISHLASSLQRDCRYQRSVLSCVECVKHGSTRTTRTFRSRRQSSRFFFCWKAVDMMHLSTCFTKHGFCPFTAEWSWRKRKWASAARAFAHARI